jgi:hypothetical protein
MGVKHRALQKKTMSSEMDKDTKRGVRNVLESPKRKRNCQLVAQSGEKGSHRFRHKHQTISELSQEQPEGEHRNRCDKKTTDRQCSRAVAVYNMD